MHISLGLNSLAGSCELKAAKVPRNNQQFKLQVDPSEIGIISPYRRQVQKIRDLMNRKFQHKHEFRDWKNITVGSTEEFQVNIRQCFALASVLFVRKNRSTNLFTKQ